MSHDPAGEKPRKLDVASVASVAMTHDGEYPVISTKQLFQQHNAVRIEHRGQHYLLRLTRENKLILTK